MGEGKHLFSSGQRANSAATVETAMEVLQEAKKKNCQSTIWSTYATHGCIYMSQRLLLLQRHILLQRHLLSLFITSLFTTARKQTTQISTNWWISNENLAYVCNKILFSYFKKNKIVKFAGKWMESEIIILNKVIQTQEGKCHMLSLIFGCWLLIFKYVCFFGNARRI